MPASAFLPKRGPTPTHHGTFVLSYNAPTPDSASDGFKAASTVISMKGSWSGWELAFAPIAGATLHGALPKDATVLTECLGDAALLAVTPWESGGEMRFQPPGQQQRADFAFHQHMAVKDFGADGGKTALALQFLFFGSCYFLLLMLLRFLFNFALAFALALALSFLSHILFSHF